jgi:hypothetical protein
LTPDRVLPTGCVAASQRKPSMRRPSPAGFDAECGVALRDRNECAASYRKIRALGLPSKGARHSTLGGVQLGVFEHPAVDRFEEAGQIDVGESLILGPSEQFLVANRTLGVQIEHV